jgi:exonuclease III
VEINQKAVHGVGFIIHPNTAKEIKKIEHISERIIILKIHGTRTSTTIIQIYAPTNDKAEEKEHFFNTLSDIINQIPTNDDLFIMGDFNGHMGQRRTPWTVHGHQQKVQLKRTAHTRSVCRT